MGGLADRIISEHHRTMSVHDEKDGETLLEREHSGPYDLESALFSKTLGRCSGDYTDCSRADDRGG
jgi:hypothetical protein